MSTNDRETFRDVLLHVKEAIPQEFKDVAIINPYVRKGKAQIFGNHRGIFLLYCLLLGRYWPNPIDLLHEYLDLAEILPVRAWIQESQKTNRYYHFSQEFSTEISKTKYGSQHNLCRQCQSF